MSEHSVVEPTVSLRVRDLLADVTRRGENPDYYELVLRYQACEACDKTAVALLCPDPDGESRVAYWVCLSHLRLFMEQKNEL